MENFWLFLLNVNIFFQQLGEGLFTPMRFLSFLGDEEFYLVVMPAIYWCYDSRIGVKVGLLLMLSNGVNAFFKFLFHAPRPFWLSDKVTPMVTEIILWSTIRTCAKCCFRLGIFCYAHEKNLDPCPICLSDPSYRSITTLFGCSFPS